MTQTQKGTEVRRYGNRVQYVTGGGDCYVVDTDTNEASEILTEDEEKRIESGEITLDEIYCYLPM